MLNVTSSSEAPQTGDRDLPRSIAQRNLRMTLFWAIARSKREIRLKAIDCFRIERLLARKSHLRQAFQTILVDQHVASFKVDVILAHLSVCPQFSEIRSRKYVVCPCQVAWYLSVQPSLLVVRGRFRTTPCVWLESPKSNQRKLVSYCVCSSIVFSGSHHILFWFSSRFALLTTLALTCF